MNGQPQGAEKWTLDQVRAAFLSAGCQQLYAKILAKNDDSKKQIYLGSDLSALSLFPFSTPYPSDRSRSKGLFADLEFLWLVENGALTAAPTAKFIVYPDYPEVRLSGFLKGCSRAPSEALVEYAGESMPYRVLFLGVRGQQIVGMLTASNAALQKQVLELPESETRGLFHSINLHGKLTTRSQLAKRLGEIYSMGWLPAKRLSAGKLVDCNGSNCGGYTLEAALGISANGLSAPDYLGWEVKQHTVSRLDNPSSGVVTLFTPEPKGGVYNAEGVEAFVRRYGYADKKGRAHRMNFGGLHRCGVAQSTTQLTLTCNGFDAAKGTISNFDGGVELIEADGTVAMRWGFSDLLEHWKRKHAATAFVPSQMRKNGATAYRYGFMVTLGEGTDFILFLKALAAGRVYYDPGIKLEGINTATPTTKRRSQFRSKFADLASLYHRMELVDVRTPIH